MSHCPNYDHLLVMPRLQVQAANAISSPLTHGFPSVTAFIGLMWALQRKAAEAGITDVTFRAVGVVCHRYQELVSEGHIKTFSLTRNPVGKDGKTAAIVEEGRIHLGSSRWRPRVLALTGPPIRPWPSSSAISCTACGWQAVACCLPDAVRVRIGLP